MKKGLITTLLAVAASFSGISSSYAAAPVIGALPDIRIGDQEDNASTDNNFFVFTNAFRLDDFVSDADTTVSQLRWSFDEGDDPGAAVGVGTNWYRVNNIGPIHVGGNQQVADGTSFTAHLNPGASDIRLASAYATFRDIVFTPGSGPVGTGPISGRWAAPVDPAKSAHAAGKFVTFFVSDGSAVAQDTILVRTVDNTTDFASPVGYNPQITNQFTAGAETWSMINPSGTNGTNLSYDASNGALTITVNSTSTKFRSNGWQDLSSNPTAGTGGLPYSSVGSGNFVRAKFHIFASGQSSPSQIPIFRMRIAYRFAITSILDVYHHQTGSSNNLLAQEYRPTSDPAKPSVYRVDMDPPEIPILVNEGTTQGLIRQFENYSQGSEPQEIGSISMTESSIGVYPALNLTTSATKTWAGSSDFVLLTDPNSAGGPGQVYTQAFNHERGDPDNDGNPTEILQHQVNGGAVAGDSAVGIGSTTNITFVGGNGISISTINAADTIIAIAAADWLSGDAEDADLTKEARIEPNKQYVTTFRATSSVAPSNNAMIRFRSRTIGFDWTQRLEVGGSWATGSSGSPTLVRNLTDNNRAAQQYLPSSTPQLYHVLMMTPMLTDIRADSPSSATLADRMPLISAQGGPGVNSASKRQIGVGIDILDSLSGSYFTAGSADPAEKGQVTVDQIEIRTYDKVAD
jgi:hypothetical protein